MNGSVTLLLKWLGALITKSEGSCWIVDSGICENTFYDGRMLDSLYCERRFFLDLVLESTYDLVTRSLGAGFDTRVPI